MSLNSLGTSNGGLPSSRMTHSLSTPSGVDGSASTNSRGGGKKLAVRVQMLDDSMTLFQVQVCRFVFGYFLILFFTIFDFCEWHVKRTEYIKKISGKSTRKSII